MISLTYVLFGMLSVNDFLSSLNETIWVVACGLHSFPTVPCLVLCFDGWLLGYTCVLVLACNFLVHVESYLDLCVHACFANITLVYVSSYPLPVQLW